MICHLSTHPVRTVSVANTRSKIFPAVASVRSEWTAHTRNEISNTAKMMTDNAKHTASWHARPAVWIKVLVAKLLETRNGLILGMKKMGSYVTDLIHAVT